MRHRRHRRPRLFWAIVRALVGTALAAMLVAGVLSAWLRDDHVRDTVVERGLRELAATLPDDAGLQGAADAMGDRLDASVTVWDDHGALLASHGPPADPGPPGWFADHHQHGLRVEDLHGRSVAFGIHHEPRAPLVMFAIGFGVLGVFALGVGGLARRLACRLEALRATADAWGAGDLSARAKADGEDEIAQVAAAFNRAAALVEDTLAAHRRTLASVSHELRSPLARLRMAMELLGGDDPETEPLRAQAEADITELDATIGDLLQVGRLQAVGVTEPAPVDVVALAQELCVPVVGDPLTVDGDARLLRRLLRNLVENGRRYGGVTVRVSGRALAVEDDGPGVPASEVDRIFEPFYRPKDHAEGRDGGVGLGLWLVREIARGHRADVSYEPREGGGSRFVVRFGAT